MKEFFFLAMICAMIYTSSAAAYRSAPSTNKDFPCQCYVESEKKGYTVGKHTPKGTCKELICNEDFSYEVYTCGLVGPPDGYHNEIDYSKPYPDCCVNLVKD